MNFLNPTAWLWLIAIGFLVLFFLLKPRKDHSSNYYSGPSELLRKHSHRLRRHFRLLFIFQVLGFLLLTVSIARPALVTKIIEKYTEGIDILLVLDVSESMDATDFNPNRIVVAKKVISRFISQRNNDRIGLVVFGGEAVTKAPLTRDYRFLQEQVGGIQLRELAQGTAIGMALSNAVSRLRDSTAKSKVVVLLTDGDNNVGYVNPMTASQLAKEENIKIYTIGIGKKSRVVVPIYAYDSRGRKTHLLTKVPSYLNPELLQKISLRTGGKSYMASNAEGLNQILDEIDRLETTPIKMNGNTKNEEIYFWFAVIGTFLLGICLLLTETRYRKIRLAAAS